MTITPLRLRLRPETLAIGRLDPGAPLLPDWASSASSSSGFISVTRTGTELSIVAPDAAIPSEVRAERGWRAFEFEGPIPFGLTGILASALVPLAEAGTGIFALSTFDTDLVLVKAEDLARAIDALGAAGHVIT